MPDVDRLKREQFIDLMAVELARVAYTTANPSRFLAKSGEALREALQHVVQASFIENGDQLVGMIDLHFPEAMARALGRLLVVDGNLANPTYKD